MRLEKNRKVWAALIRFLLVVIVVGVALVPAEAAPLPVTTPAGGSTFEDTTADRVLGQPGFTTNAIATTSTGMNGPSDVAFDASGRLFVVDQGNHRVLVFDNPTSGDSTADTVLGQPNFTTSASATTATGLKTPNALAFDASGRLFVLDGGNHRVLIYDNPTAANGAAADTVLGQPNFTTSAFATTATGMSNPTGLAFDAFGRLFVADKGNHRLLVFDNPTAANGAAADTVLGQPNFTSQVFQLTATGMQSPFSVAFDSSGRLFVADQGNRRVLVFDNPTSGDTTADTVIGQPNFTSAVAATTATGMKFPFYVAFDAGGRLFVADGGSNRVLVFDNPTNDTTADTVLGQPNFTTSAFATTATGMDLPLSLAFDTSGRLFVADISNKRVLVFDTGPPPRPPPWTPPFPISGTSMTLRRWATASRPRSVMTRTMA